VQWSVGSDPAASPWAGKSEPNAQPWQSRDASAPYPKQVLHEPSQPMQAVVTMDVRPKRRWPIVLGALALLGLGGAIAAVAVSHSGDQPAQPKAATTEVKATTVPVEPPKVPVQVEAPKQPVVDTPKQQAVEPPKQVETPKQPVVETPKQQVKKTPVKTTHETVKTVPKAGQETKAVEPPQQTAPVLQKPKCDPFASMHDCNNSK